SAAERACTPRPPPKMTSRIDCPRTARGDCSPIAHRTASVTFDLPDPLGPTTTETPGPKSSFVRSGKDLKPLRVSDLRCMGSPPSVPQLVLVRGTRSVGVEGLERNSRSFLLGMLLRAARPAPDGRPADRRDDLERAVVRRAVLGRDLVLDGLGAPRETLLQRRLEVDR